MVLFSRRIRIQRNKIHKNSRVPTPAQYIFLWVCVIIHLIIWIFKNRCFHYYIWKIQK